MATANRYSGYTVNFIYGSAQTLALTQVRNVDVEAANQFNETIVSGALDRGAVTLRTSGARARVTTEDLLTPLGQISPTVGLPCTGLCTFQWQKRSDSGTFAGSTTNIKAVAQTGFLQADSISASGDSPATLDLSFFSLWDGTNDPWVFTDSVAVAGSAPGYLSEYYLGPVYVGAGLVQGLISSRVNFGIHFAPLLADGDTFPRSGAILARRPTISLTMTKVNWITGQMASMFNNALGSAIKVYYVQGSPGGGRTAYASAAHCKITASTGAMNSRNVAFRDNGDATVTVDVVPTGTIAMSIASAIP